MKLKLDENLGQRGVELLRQASHDVATVTEQGLQSAADSALIEICQIEGRCLVTLDLDFSNPLRFNPTLYAGIIVLRLPPKPSPQDLMNTLQTLGIRHLHQGTSDPLLPYSVVWNLLQVKPHLLYFSKRLLVLGFINGVGE